jgi:hypothetical protein
MTMAGRQMTAEQASQRLVAAHALCLCLGLALLIWSLAPAVVERVLTGHAPHWTTLAFSSLTFVVGLLFVTFHFFIRGGTRWAMWAAFGLALLLASAGIMATMMTSASTPALFSLVLATGTVIATWLALQEKQTGRPRRAK